MTTHQELAARALQFVEAIASETQNIKAKATLRNRLVLAAYGTVMEHHHAIAILVREQRLPSAFALTRSLWESYIRGDWLLHFVEEDKLPKYTKGKLPEAWEVLRDLKTIPEFDFGVLAKFKADHWSALCDYAHTGPLQLQRWQGEEFIEPNHPVEETAEVLYLAGHYAALAGAKQAVIGGDDAKGLRLLELARSIKL